MSTEVILIKGADWVLTMDPELGDMAHCDVLIEGTRITSVGTDLEVDGAEVVDARNMIVVPGFVDTHRHLWQTAMRNIASDWTLAQYLVAVLGNLAPAYRPSDVYAGNLLGSLEALDHGITTTLDWSHCAIATPDHTDAAIAALEESGSRAVFAYGHGAPIWADPDRKADWAELERLASGWSSPSGRVTLASALRGPDFGSLARAIDDWQRTRELGLPISVHIGVAGRAERPVAQLHDAGLLDSDTTYVHCSRLSDDELKMIADSGGSVSVATEVEMHMGHGWPPTGRLMAAGVRPSLSIDVCTGIGGDMFTAMRTTLAMQRALDNDAVIRAGKTPEVLSITARDVLSFATIEGARTLGLQSVAGSVTPGKEADLVMLRANRLNMMPVDNNPVAAVALAANSSNVDSVMVGGRFVKRAGELVGVDLDRIRGLVEASRDHLVAATPGAVIGGSWQPPSTW